MAGTGNRDTAERRLLPGLGLVACAGLAGLGAWRGEYDVVALALLAAAALARSTPRRTWGTEAGEREDPATGASGPAPLLAALPDPAILVDGRLLVAAMNEPARRLVPGLGIGHPLSFGIRAPQVLDAATAVLRSGTAGEVEFGGRRAGEPTWLVRVRRVADDPGPPAALLSLSDLTAQRRSESMRVDFVANVSHELRTPLASILGFVETLLGPAKADPEARARFLGIIRAQANRMSRLVDDLLQLSRVEMREHRLPGAAVDLAAIATQVLEATAPLARERDVRLSLGGDPGPLVVAGDRDELLRLAENLVVNAVKYGGQGGRVEIVLARSDDGRTVELAVRDEGPGIAPEHLPRLTERFYRVDVSASRAQGGTGLGLAIVKHIAARHRGRLLVESAPGQGATFRVRLPALEPSGTPASPMPAG